MKRKMSMPKLIEKKVKLRTQDDDDYSLDRMKFKIMTKEEVENQAVVKITNPTLFDGMKHPAPNGLYDLKMGPLNFDRRDTCFYCKSVFPICTGHYGFISFPRPLYNPFLLNEIFKLLKMSCFYCHHLYFTGMAYELAVCQLTALDLGLFDLPHELEAYYKTLKGKGPHKDGNNPEKIKQIRFFFNERSKQSTQLHHHGNNGFKHSSKYILARQQVKKNLQLNHLSKKCCFDDTHNIHKFKMIKKQFYGEVDPKALELDSMDKKIEMLSPKSVVLNPLQVKKHFQLLYRNCQEFLDLYFKFLFNVKSTWEKTYPTDIFFMENLAVEPNYLRPVNFVNGEMLEHKKTSILNSILIKSIDFQTLILNHNKEESALRSVMTSTRGSTKGEKLFDMWNQLQQNVNILLDYNLQNRSSDQIFPGSVKQVLERKEGLIRSNIMAKRVNYCGRTVIGPDPLINVDEVGFPKVFAQKLTFPEEVNDLNLKKMQYLVRRGPNNYPGAVNVRIGGNMITLDPNNFRQRNNIAKLLGTRHISGGHIESGGSINVVYRQLVDGDILIMNRQPTLHRPSMMAHKAHVLPNEKIMRLHYATCKSYNADFDGDELNCHFPQSIQARVEAMELASVAEHFLSPKDGSPLGGLIQDHIIAAGLISLPTTFFDKSQYMHWVHAGLSSLEGDIKLLPPTLIRPVTLWTGKQLFSTLIINLIPEGMEPPNLVGKNKINPKIWTKNKGKPEISLSESEIIFQKGELLCGFIDKTQIGSSPFGILHLCHELYGGKVTIKIESALSKMLSHYLGSQHFSMGINDVLLTDKGRKKLEIFKQKIVKQSHSAICELLEADLNTSDKELGEKMKYNLLAPGSRMSKELDETFMSLTKTLSENVTTFCMKKCLRKSFPENALQMMIHSGAKGSMVNVHQMSCMLGQIMVAGRRIQNCLSGGTLPPFPFYDTTPFSGGFCPGNLSTGLSQPEAFFHGMAAREGMCDTAVKTANSGYLQRCLIKNLESIKVCFDFTVRDADNSIIQFLYGEDGLCPSEGQLLIKNKIPLMVANYKNFLDEETIQQVKNHTSKGMQAVELQKKKIKKWCRENGGKKYYHTLSGFNKFVQENFGDPRLIKKDRSCLIKRWHNLDPEVKERYNSSSKPLDPVLIYANPSPPFGCVSERVEDIIKSFKKENTCTLPNDLRKNNWKKFKDMIYLKYQKAMAVPGDPVGVLAAQSVGEPSTQMTLNTFHFAGMADMNVTLGIPRLVEILKNATDKIGTPMMDIYFLPTQTVEELQKNVQLMLKVLTPVSYFNVLKRYHIIQYDPIPAANGKIKWPTTIRFEFLSSKFIASKYLVTQKHIQDYFGKTFAKLLCEKIRLIVDKQLKSPESLFTSYASSKVGPEAETTQNVEDEPEDDNEKNIEEENLEKNEDDDYSFSEVEEEEPSEKEDDESNEIIETVKKEEEEEIDATAEQCAEGLAADYLQFVNEVVASHKYITKYSYDQKDFSWCELSLEIVAKHRIQYVDLIQKLLKTKFIYKIPGINRAFHLRVEKESGNKFGNKIEKESLIKTEGANLRAIKRYSHIIDVSRLYTNDIHAIKREHGITAAYGSLIREVNQVFSMYGINVDHHHLSLIADYMTHYGDIRPCNRRGVSTNPSPFQKLSFETALTFIKDSLLDGTVEKMESSSANVAFGKLAKVGTGLFDLISNDVELYNEHG